MIWVVCIFCSCFARSANVHRRATGATGDRAPLLQLQHEHERKELGIPTRLPLAYHPRQFQNNTENPAVELRPAYTRTSRINPNQTINSAQSFPVQTDQPPRVTNNACWTNKSCTTRFPQCTSTYQPLQSFTKRILEWHGRKSQGKHNKTLFYLGTFRCGLNISYC